MSRCGICGSPDHDGYEAECEPTAVDVDALDKLREAAALGSLRVGEHYGIHLYAGGNPVGTTLRAADAALIVAAVNALPELLAEVRRGRALREAVEGLAGLVEQGRAWTGDSLARRLRAVVAAVDGGEQR